jgi:hypothetical protein
MSSRFDKQLVAAPRHGYGMFAILGMSRVYSIDVKSRFRCASSRGFVPHDALREQFMRNWRNFLPRFPRLTHRLPLCWMLQNLR